MGRVWEGGGTGLSRSVSLESSGLPQLNLLTPFLPTTVFFGLESFGPDALKWRRGGVNLAGDAWEAFVAALPA